MNMKTWCLPLIALCGALALPVLGDEKKEPPKVETPKVEPYKLGSTVDENLVLRDLDGKEVKFKELRGKVVMVHFWSKDCPYEVMADPKVQELEKRWKDKNVAVLAIASNATEIGAERPTDAGYADIRAHMKKKGLENRLFADHGNKVADLFVAKSTPHCFVLDAKGVIVYAGGLDDDPKGDKGGATQAYVRDAVESTLEGKEVKVKESKPYGCSIKRVTPKA